MKKYLKRSIIMLFVISLLPISSVSAKSNYKNSQYKKAMIAFNEILENQDSSDKFMLKDLDKDGSPELIIKQDDNGIDIHSFNYIFGLTKRYDMPVTRGTLYYSEENNSILSYSKYDMEKEWSFYGIINSQQDSPANINTFGNKYKYVNEYYEEFAKSMTNFTMPILKKGYYSAENAWSNDYVKSSKKAVLKAIEEITPNKVKLTPNIKNTKANRKKYFTDVKVFKSF